MTERAEQSPTVHLTLSLMLVENGGAEALECSAQLATPFTGEDLRAASDILAQEIVRVLRRAGALPPLDDGSTNGHGPKPGDV